MSPVFQDFGPGIGAGISAGIQGAIGAGERKRASQLFEQQLADHMTAQTLQRAQLASQGIHLLAPGELPPMKEMADDITDRIPRVIAPSTMPQASIDAGGLPTLSNGSAPSQAPSRAAAGRQNIPGRPASNGNGGVSDPNAMFRDLIAGMGGNAQPVPRFETGQGYYIDRKPQQDAAALARSQKMEDQFMPMLVQRMVGQQDRNDKIGRYVAAGVAPERAALYADNPSLADNDPKVGKPHTDVMAERTPKSVLLNGKPAEVLVDKAGNIFDTNGQKVTGQITPYVAPPNEETAALRELAFGQRKESLLARTEARLVGQYHNATKKYSQTADALQAIAENRAGALKGDPIAQQTLLQDFIKLNLPGQIVTEGELHHYAGLMGLGDKGGQLLQKLQQGSPLSEKQIQLILSHSDNLAAERRKAAKFLRDSYIQRGARQGVPEDSFEDWFGFLPQQGETPPPPPAGGDTAGQTIVVNGKTFKVPH